MVVAYLGLLAQRKSDFDHSEAYRADPFFGFSVGIAQVPSSPTLREHLDQAAVREDHPVVHWGAIIRESTIGTRQYIPRDCDVSPSSTMGRPRRKAFGEAPRRGHARERCVYQVIERTITADCQILLIPDIEVSVYWTSVTATPDDVLPWYPDHGTMEQYHSEVETDMHLERLPSGKVAANQLVRHLACLTYNLLRIIGQATVGRQDVPLRNAAKLVAHASQYRIRYGRGNRWGRVTGQLYAHFAAG